MKNALPAKRVENLKSSAKSALAARMGENPQLVTHVTVVKTVAKPSAKSVMNSSRTVNVKRVNIPA